MQLKCNDVNGQLVGFRFQFMRDLARIASAVLFSVRQEYDDGGLPRVLECDRCSFDS